MNNLKEITELTSKNNWISTLKDSVVWRTKEIWIEEFADDIASLKNAITWGIQALSDLYEILEIKMIEEILMIETCKLKNNNKIISELLDNILKNSLLIWKVEPLLSSSPLKKWYLKYKYYNEMKIMKIINEDSRKNYEKAKSDLELLPNFDFKMLIQKNIDIKIVYELEISYLGFKKTLQKIFSESRDLYNKTLKLLYMLNWENCCDKIID